MFILLIHDITLKKHQRDPKWEHIYPQCKNSCDISFSRVTPHIRIIASTPPPPPSYPLCCSHLFMEVEFIQLWEHPTHAAISPAHQNPKSNKLLEEPQAESGESRMTREENIRRETSSEQREVNVKTPYYFIAIYLIHLNQQFITVTHSRPFPDSDSD